MCWENADYEEKNVRKSLSQNSTNIRSLKNSKELNLKNVRFLVLTAVKMIFFFWVVMLSGLVDSY
jgi:hypothetical protein